MSLTSLRTLNRPLVWILLWGLLAGPYVALSPAKGEGAATAVAQGASNSRPNYAAQALIRRDKYGVPHILAETEAAAAYAHGYVTAEDHGALLARAFLRARGMLASVFGDKYIDEDIHTRTLRIYDTAAERFKELPPFMQAILDGYALGYSDYLALHRSELPDWATPVTGVDVLAHACAALLIDFAIDPRPWQKSARQAASNMWAIGPTRSATGRAMLLANPHLGWEAEIPLQEAHITVPDVININGVTFIGVPVVTIGFNGSLGWAHTVNRFHADDVYELTLNSEGTSYIYDGQWLPLTPRPFTIQVNKGKKIETKEHTALWSHYGPIIRVSGGKAYAYKSPNLGAINFLTQYNLMGKAKTLRDFMAAVKMQELPMFNIAYADKAGNILYLFNARIPIRPVGYDVGYGGGAVPGNTSKSEWFTVWPIGDLPQLLNPQSGYLQNCNDAPWYANLEQNIDRTRFAEYLPFDVITWRAMFSLKTLSSEKSMTLDKLLAHKYNAKIIIAERVKGDLLTIVRAAGEELREAADILERWDDSASANSRGAVLFYEWWGNYSRSVPQPFRVPSSSTDPLGAPAGIADQAKALEAFRRAVASVKKNYGALDTPWGETHRARRGNLDLPLGGSDHTFLRVSYKRAADGKDVATAGDAYALAVEFGETPRAFSIIPYSEASNPKSPYYNNQLQLYAEGKFKPAWFLEQDIKDNLDRQYRPGQ